MKLFQYFQLLLCAILSHKWKKTEERKYSCSRCRFFGTAHIFWIDGMMRLPMIERDDSASYALDRLQMVEREDFFPMMKIPENEINQ